MDFYGFFIDFFIDFFIVIFKGSILVCIYQPQVPLRLPCFDFRPVSNHGMPLVKSILQVYKFTWDDILRSYASKSTITYSITKLLITAVFGCYKDLTLSDLT